MCHHVHVTLSAEEQKDVKKLSGIMIPVYASIVLATIAVVSVTAGPSRGGLVATAAAPAAIR